MSFRKNETCDNAPLRTKGYSEIKDKNAGENLRHGIRCKKSNIQYVAENIVKIRKAIRKTLDKSVYKAYT